MTFDLFNDSSTFIELDIPDAQCILYPNLFSYSDADQYLIELKKSVQWSQEIISMYGKKIKVPRLSAWYGEENLAYEYSGIKTVAIPWIPALKAIKNKIELATRCTFNSVLINLYRDGNDSVDWHSDDEPELGIAPVIASVSFGEQRKFQLKNKFDPNIKHSVMLPHGSLLIMSGKTQANWLHKIAKSKREMATRINLTFRTIRD